MPPGSVTRVAASQMPGPGFERRHRPVAAERDAPAAGHDAPPRPGAGEALAARRCPATARQGAAWFMSPSTTCIGCCDAMIAELPEACDVVLGNRLDVLEPMTAAARRSGVDRGRVFERVERHPDGAVADGVDLHLQPALVEHRDDSVQFLRREIRRAGAGAVRVRAPASPPSGSR